MPLRAEDFGVEPNKDCTKQLQAACEAAVKAGAELVLQPGAYMANIELNEVRGLILRGSGRLTTLIKGIAPDKPAFKATGFWYSRIQDLGFGVSKGLKEHAVVEIDGSPKMGVQANTYDNLLINARGVDDGQRSRVAMSMCAKGGSGAQGSEQVFLNCHFSGASNACYFQHGYNALNNQFIGGNFQDYSRNGIWLVFGSMQIFGVGFQSTTGYEQILNDGWDIQADSGGVGDALVIAGCRTESLRFLKGCGAQPPQVSSCLQRSAVQPWFKSMQYKLNDAVVIRMPATAEAPEKDWLMRCLVAHTSDKEPNWLSPGPNWEPITFNVVDILDGIIDNSYFQVGNVSWFTDKRDAGLQINADCTAPDHIRHIFVDATKGPVKVSLPWPQQVPHGTEITIIKGDATNNPVSVHTGYIDNSTIHVLQLSLKNRVLRLKALGGGTLTRRFYRV